MSSVATSAGAPPPAGEHSATVDPPLASAPPAPALQQPQPGPPQVIDIASILNRDDFTITTPSRYSVRFRSEGPPAAEIHLVTSAHLVLPDSRACKKLPEELIPDLMSTRLQMLARMDEEKRTDETTTTETTAATDAPNRDAA